MQTQLTRTERNRIAILNALRRTSHPTTSVGLVEALNESGQTLSERAIRLYLADMDDQGLTERHGRRGRTLTDKGIAELRAAQALERVGFLSARIDQMTYRMTFDMQTRSGQVVVNTSMVSPARLQASIDKVCQVFEQGFAMGTLVGLLPPGEKIGDATVPHDRVGFCTVCSITLNGVLLKHGVPTASRFGGLLQVRNRQPTRFVEMIHYDGTSIDPLEVFIRSGMTDYHGAIRTGDGLIGASFREMPGDSRDVVLQVAQRLEAIGLNAIMRVGLPGQPLLGLPVSEGRFGCIVIGGLNPIAILEEAGQRVESRALAGLLDYTRLIPYTDLPSELAKLTDEGP